MSLANPVDGASLLLSGIPFAVAGDPVAEEIVAVLGGRAMQVNDRDRALYHATAAVASNHLVALIAQVERLAEVTGLQLDLFGPLITQSLSAALADPAAALTGPASRGDWDTIQRHLSALPADEVSDYLALSLAAARLAGQTPPEGVAVQAQTPIEVKADE